MTVRKIVAEWLKAHGYDGLCNYNCGCGGTNLDDLMPCEDGGNIGSCVPAYRHVCAGTAEECEDCGNEVCDGSSPGTVRFAEHRPVTKAGKTVRLSEGPFVRCVAPWLPCGYRANGLCTHEYLCTLEEEIKSAYYDECTGEEI